jgi:signal transduction histidine kinase
VELDVPPGAVTVVGDAAQMQVAITNLLMNAVEALEPQGSGTGRVRIGVLTGEQAAECVVGDSGPGYEPGRARPSEAAGGKRGGTGMGLHIVRNVVDNHRGRLEIGRSPLGGAEFRIVLPHPA